MLSISWSLRCVLPTLVLWGAAMFAAPVTAQATGDRKPNVILIVADDLGYGEFPPRRPDRIPMPHLESLAKSGIDFTAGYVTAPFCAPSRAGLLTGRYQQRFGFELNPVEKMNDLPHVGLPAKERTIADYLKAGGYATGLVGKWHLGVHEPHHPLVRGFDSFYGFLREGHYYFPPPYDGPADRHISHLRPREPDYDRLNPILRGRQPVEEAGNLTAALGREAAAFVDANKDRPYFLYLAFNAPHSPMQAAAADYARFPEIPDKHRRVFAAMCAAMDDAVGQVLAAVQRTRRAEDTIIVFLSDNGGPTKELTSRNDPLSGGKGSMQEGGIRVPFVLHWPRRLKPGRFDSPVSSLDILPTLLSAAQLAAPEGVELDGFDLLPWLDGKRTGRPHETLFWKMGAKLAIRQGDWKLLRDAPGQPFRLYDLKVDEAEAADQASARPELASRLAERLIGWQSGLAPSLWKPDDK